VHAQAIDNQLTERSSCQCDMFEEKLPVIECFVQNIAAKTSIAGSKTQALYIYANYIYLSRETKPLTRVFPTKL